MKRKKTIKLIRNILLLIVAIGAGVVLYLFNMPHRDVTSTEADYSVTASDIVAEYLQDPKAANEKYLAEDGNSKVLFITGTVARVSTDFDGNKVILLKEAADKAGVRSVLSADNNPSQPELELGQEISVKGVIRSGASYDSDLEMYEDVFVEKSILILNQK